MTASAALPGAAEWGRSSPGTKTGVVSMSPAEQGNAARLGASGPNGAAQTTPLARRDPDWACCLAAGGEMGARIRSFDWSSTPLGPIGGWPSSLRETVSLCLRSRFQLAIYWGPQLILLYNDAEDRKSTRLNSSH